MPIFDVTTGAFFIFAAVSVWASFSSFVGTFALRTLLTHFTSAKQIGVLSICKWTLGWEVHIRELLGVLLELPQKQIIHFTYFFPWSGTDFPEHLVVCWLRTDVEREEGLEA